MDKVNTIEEAWKFCEKLTPTQRLKCAKLTRDNVLNGSITEDMVKELGYNSLK